LCSVTNQCFLFIPFPLIALFSYCFSWLRQLAWTNLPFLAQHQRTGRLERTFFRARICKRLRSPGIDCEESIPPAYDILQRKSHFCIPFLGIAGLRGLSPNFHIYVCVCERFMYSQNQSTSFLQQNRQIDRGNS
jgi:hypothetical protein